MNGLSFSLYHGGFTPLKVLILPSLHFQWVTGLSSLSSTRFKNEQLLSKKNSFGTKKIGSVWGNITSERGTVHKMYLSGSVSQIHWCTSLQRTKWSVFVYEYVHNCIWKKCPITFWQQLCPIRPFLTCATKTKTKVSFCHPTFVFSVRYSYPSVC